MDRNTVIGFVLLGILLFLYLYLSTQNSQQLALQKKRIEDSTAVVTAKKDQQFNATRDSVLKTTSLKDTAGLQNAPQVSEQLLTVDNELMRIVFTNKGAQPKQVLLKKYHSFDSTLVNLVGADDRISYAINTTPGQAAQVADLYFTAAPVVKNPDGSQVVSFRLAGTGGQQVTHQYTIHPDNYAIDWDIITNGADRFFTQGNLNLHWHAQPLKKTIRRNIRAAGFEHLFFGRKQFRLYFF